ncbi:MAG: molybdopterin adenylyltransferase [Dehalococcoidia bacterium]
MFSVAILTISDRSFKGERQDASGPAIQECLAPLGVRVLKYEIVPDERDMIVDRLTSWIDQMGPDVVFTTGGTGLGPRDVTPEATLEVVDRVAPGFGEAMRWQSLQKTPTALLSRATAGIRKGSLIINLPGSPRAVRESLEVILPALPHAVETLRGEAKE